MQQLSKANILSLMPYIVIALLTVLCATFAYYSLVYIPQRDEALQAQAVREQRREELMERREQQRTRRQIEQLQYQ